MYLGSSVSIIPAMSDEFSDRAPKLLKMSQDVIWFIIWMLKERNTSYN